MHCINGIVGIVLVGIFFSACQKPLEFQVIKDIQIIRDKWGVPHIIAPTDEEVAYGLAWAECEDDFITIQEQMLALKGKLGEVKGKDGLVADFAIKFMGIVDHAKEKYPSELSPKMIKILEHFAAGINAYGARYPGKLISKDFLPVGVEHLLAGNLLGLIEISGAGQDLQKIMDGSIVKYLNPDIQKGSNAIAINSSLSSDGDTYLAINSHQPLEGWYSWYEAHLISDEGQNILGGTFPGGVTIFHGVNENLGWAQTVNAADFSDVFQLKMHPQKDYHYEWDGEWKKLEKKHVWAWLKVLGPIKIPIRRTIYESKLGTTFETEHGFFAWKFQALESVKSAEQWYKMNRASNFDEFSEALKMRAIPCTNIVYADKADNIYYLSNGTFPGRKPGYEWDKVLPGYSSEIIYDDSSIPFDSLPQVLNPDCGFVFNTNNTPYSSTCENENHLPNSVQDITSYMPAIAENNRSTRFLELIAQYESVSYDDFKTIKYDQTYPSNMTTPQANNLEELFHLQEAKYPEISDAIKLLKEWNRSTDIDNESALFYILCHKELWELMKTQLPLEYGHELAESEMVAVITKIKQSMLEEYGSIKVKLGDYQRHIRGKVDIAISGGPDVLAAIHTKKLDDGRYKAVSGESYIALVRFRKQGLPMVETIHSYGSSADPDSDHYTDQMQLFADHKLKPMTLDREAVIAQADTIYHPLKME